MNIPPSKTNSEIVIDDIHAKENCLIYYTANGESKSIKWSDDFNVDQIPNNLCLTGTIYIHGETKFYAPLMSKVVSWKIENLRILFGKELSLKEFKMLINSRNLKTVHFAGRIVIKKKDGEILSFEDTLQYFTNLVKIEIQPVSPIADIDKFKALRFPKLKWFGLIDFDESFDLKTFKDFVLSRPNVEFEIFSWHGFSEEYTRNVQFHVDEIIKNQYSSVPLHISFPGQTEESKALLKKQQEKCQRRKTFDF